MGARFQRWGKILSAAVLPLLLLMVSSDAFADWLWANPLPQGNILDDVTWGGNPGHFVAVGQMGTILVSTTGASGTWQVEKSGTNQWLQDIVWSDTRAQFVAVGFQGTVLTSPDGLQWTIRDPKTSTSLYAVTWTGSTYVAVGANGMVDMSPDGVAWTPHPSGVQAWLNDVAWNGSRYVAVGSGGTILYSPDAVTWSSSSMAGTTTSLESITWNGSTFVAVGQGAILTSPTGLPGSWQTQVPATNEWLRKVEWVGDRFVITGGGGTLLTSPDGKQWTAVNSNSTSLLEVIARAPDGTEVIVGKYGTLLQNTGSGWKVQTIGDQTLLHGVALNGNGYVAVGDQGTIITGVLDGTPSTQRTSGTSASLDDVIWDGARYIAVGDKGTALQSADGTTWGPLNWGTTARLNHIAFGTPNGTPTYVAVGDGGTVLSGTDRTALIAQKIGTANLNDVVWTGTRFVAAGDGGVLLASPDGSTWTPLASGTTANLRSVTWNGMYVAVGEKGTTLFSKDGVQWITTVLPTSATLNDVAWDGSRFVAAATSGPIAQNVYTSPDGQNWSVQYATGNDLYGIAANGSATVLVGEGGAVLHSPSNCPCTTADVATTSLNTPVTIAVLANDFASTPPLTLAGVDTTSAQGGTVVQNSDGTVTYTPPSGFIGTDTFHYTVTDGSGRSVSGTVTVDTLTVAPDPSGLGGSSGTTANAGSSSPGSSHGGGGTLDFLMLAGATALAWRRRRLH